MLNGNGLHSGVSPIYLETYLWITVEEDAQFRMHLLQLFVGTPQELCYQYGCRIEKGT